MPDLFDVVELAVDIPEHGLYAGQQGTVVERHSDEACEVEFTDEQGETLAMLALRQHQFVVVWRAIAGAWVPLAERVAALVAALPEDTGQEALDYVRFLHERRRRSHRVSGSTAAMPGRAA